MGQKAQTFLVSNWPEGNTKATAMASPKLAAGDGNYDFHLRSLSAASRDSAAAADPASDPNLLQSVSASPSNPLLIPLNRPRGVGTGTLTCVPWR
jgi:hypothetical protein